MVCQRAADARPCSIHDAFLWLAFQLCRAVELVIKLLSIDFRYPSNVLLSIGSTATLHYRIGFQPLITSSAVALELKVSIRIGGHIIAVPISSSPALVPVLRTHALCLGITQASMHVFLLVLVRIQPQEFICMPDVFSGAIELTDAIAVPLPSQKCPKCATESPLKVTVRVVSVPVSALEPKKSAVAISAEIGIFAKGPSGAISGLFVMRAVSVLMKVVKALLVETLMPRVNDCLSVGVLLPSLLHLRMTYPVIELPPGMLVLCV